MGLNHISLGGVDIEEVAEKTPERVYKVPVDIYVGMLVDETRRERERVDRCTYFPGTRHLIFTVF